MIRPAVVLFVLLSLLTGVLYPLAVTGMATLSPATLNVGQEFSRPEHFWGRPSAAGYNAAASSGSNLGPTSKALEDAVAARLKALGPVRPVPADLVTASGSGLDPDISPAAALYQVPRVAQARGIAPQKLEELVRAHTEGPTLGILGQPRVNVRALNAALDAGN